MTHRLERAFDHVLVIMFENQYRSYVMANPYMRGLAARGIDLANSFGVMHPSQTNYIASIAGELCNVTDDDPPPALLEQRTIVDLIEESPYGLSWKAYMDSYIPQNTPWTPELTPQDEYPYLIKHNPFSSFASIVRNESRWKRIVDESQFWKDLINGEFPEFAWFTPNMWNDGHYLDGTQKEPPERAPALVDQLALWLQGFFGALRFPGADSHLPPRTLVVVTFDEADFEKDYDATRKYTYDGPNQIYTVLLGDGIQPGVEEEGYNHYSLIRTIEQNFGLGSLQKNDAGANWYQFLWGRRFGWSAASETPIRAESLAAANCCEALYAVYSRGGQLAFRTFDGSQWSDEQPVGAAGERPALARCGGRLVLVSDTGSSLAWLDYGLDSGWSDQPQPVVSAAVTHFALASFDGGSRCMLVWREASGKVFSRIRTAGGWEPQSVDTGHTSAGEVALAVLGASLYLIVEAEGQTLRAVSYNTADFNVVTVAESRWSGPYDNTTKDAWSPSAFPVAHFAHGPNPLTAGENEPIRQPYRASAPLAAATLEGVIHLAHPGASNPQVISETFSLSGIMTPLKPVSYNQSDETTTSNGYGTLALAGWSAQEPIQGVFNRGAMAMARLGSELVLLFQPEQGGCVHLCRGVARPSRP